MNLRFVFIDALLVIILHSCIVVPRNTGYSCNWYGPASYAFDDFISYYLRLPESLDELDEFIGSRKEVVDTTMYCFGSTSLLQQELRSTKTAYEKVSEDSCFFSGLRHGRYKEQFIRYSPVYCYTNPDYSCLILYKDRLQWGKPCFFDSKNQRVAYELEESFMSIIDSVRTNYSIMVCKPWQNTFSRYHSSFLFEYSDGLKVLDVGSITNSYVAINMTTKATSTESIQLTNLERICSDYLTDIAECSSSFCNANKGITKIIFASYLFY